MQIYTPIAPINLALLQRRGFGAMSCNSKACQAAVRRLGLLAEPVSPLVQHIAITQRPLSQKSVSKAGFYRRRCRFEITLAIVDDFSSVQLWQEIILRP
jgi:hypothetical protein